MKRAHSKHIKKGSALFTTAVLIGGIFTGVCLEKGVNEMWGEGSSSFMIALIRDPRKVGAFSPSSCYAAREIVRSIVPSPDRKIRVLEVGAGTGVFTREIINRLQGYSYDLDIIELEPDFCRQLYRKFGHIKNVKIHAIDVLQWAPDKKYDVIISALPFTNFSEDFVRTVLEKYEKILVPNGRLSYIKIMVPNFLRKFFLRRKPEEFKRREEFIEHFKQKYSEETVLVFKNLPPLYVEHLRLNRVD